ncbi:MAG: DUF86 domain-containing protein [Planctomycetes bacterium]|nr:DUF86 domain-containing protein [Planctomycetota bacterium]
MALRQMRDHAHEALALARGRVRADLDSDRMLNLSLVRLLEILGEAAARVPLEERTKHPGIPWMQIVALRNRLIRAYDEVDFDVLWQILTEDLPPQVSALDGIVNPERPA